MQNESTNIHYPNCPAGFLHHNAPLLLSKINPVHIRQNHRKHIIFEKYQGNLNPLIDYPHWVEMIWENILY